MGKPAGETREGKMVIIGEKVAIERRLEDLKKKDFGDREGERELKKLRRDTVYVCFLANSTHLGKAVYVFLISLFSPLFS